MGQQYVLSGRDYERFQQMLLWHELHKNPQQFHRRRGIGGGGASVSGAIGVRWFYLDDVSSDPMTAHRVYFDSTDKLWKAWLVGPDNEILPFEVYCHPDSDVSHYPINTFVPCVRTDQDWHIIIPSTIILDVCEGE